MQTRVNSLLISTAVAACAAMLCTSQSHAQSPEPTSTPYESNAAGTGYQGFVMGSKIAGSHVKNKQNADLGTISDIVVNPDTGHIRFAILRAGGKKVAVPWSALNVENMSGSQAPKFVLDMTEAKLQKAPQFQPSQLKQLFTRTMEEPVFTYFDIIWFPDVLTPQEQSSKSERQAGAASPTASPYGTMTPTPSITP